MMLMVVARVLLVVARVLLVIVILTGWVKKNSPFSLSDILAVAAMEHDVDGGC